MCHEIFLVSNIRSFLKTVGHGSAKAITFDFSCSAEGRTIAAPEAREHGSAHYDLECYSQGWLHPELKQTWRTDRRAFVSQVRKHHDRITLDWGFSVRRLSLVVELQECGVKLVWFDGDIARAREIFAQRGGIAVKRFENQIADICTANSPASLDCVVIPRLSATSRFLGDG